MENLYHLSNVKGISILKKQIPQKIPGWDWSKEDTSIERVCFSLNIDGCFSAICPIIGEEQYLYIPKKIFLLLFYTCQLLSKSLIQEILMKFGRCKIFL